MENTRDLFKIRDTKEILHAKISTKKGQKWYGLNTAEDIKKK